MELRDFIEIVAILVGLVVLWTGIRRIEVDAPAKAILSALELLTLLLSVVLLGLVGWLVFIVANILGFVAYGVWLAARKQAILAAAAAQSGMTLQEMEALQRRLRNAHTAFRALDPIELAEFVRTLAQVGRPIGEMEILALPIALLSRVHDVDLGVLTPKFDQLLRVWGRSAGDSMKVADQLTVAVQKTPASLMDYVESLTTVGQA